MFVVPSRYAKRKNPLKTVYKLDDIDRVAKDLISAIKTKVLLFYGGMGSGKTTLINALAKALGSSDSVSSPTFSIVNEYRLPNDILFHFDLYRINTAEAAYDFGIEEYLYSKNWLAIEWPEPIEHMVPNPFDRVYLEPNTNNSRILITK